MDFKLRDRNVGILNSEETLRSSFDRGIVNEAQITQDSKNSVRSYLKGNTIAGIVLLFSR